MLQNLGGLCCRAAKEECEVIACEGGGFDNEERNFGSRGLVARGGGSRDVRIYAVQLGDDEGAVQVVRVRDDDDAAEFLLVHDFGCVLDIRVGVARGGFDEDGLGGDAVGDSVIAPNFGFGEFVAPANTASENKVVYCAPMIKIDSVVDAFAKDGGGLTAPYACAKDDGGVCMGRRFRFASLGDIDDKAQGDDAEQEETETDEFGKIDAQNYFEHISIIANGW